MKIRVLIAAWLLTVASGVAHALGLGEILVQSRLNQPLEAEILVREAFPGEAEGMTARLATTEDFTRVGLDRARVPALLRFEVVQNDRGQTVIQVRSDDPIREPFLTLLVEASWGGGRLLREYGILLDPPVGTQPSTIARVAPPVTAPPATPVVTPTAPPSPPPPAQTQALAEEPAPTPVEPEAAPVPPAPAPAPPPVVETQPPARPPTGFAPPPSARPTPVPAAPSPSTPAPAPAAVPASGRTYTVHRGDALFDIALEYAGTAGVDVNQMMVALQRENPGAFFADNINALKAGAVLRIPDDVTVRSGEASQEVQRQNQVWVGIRAATLADAGAAPRPSTRAATPSAPDARLELLPPRSDADTRQAAGRPGTEQGGANVAEVQADLQRAREDLRSREQEVEELASRVRDLEELNAKNARLLELKDSELAQLQQRLAEASAQPPPPMVTQEPVQAIAPPTSIDDEAPMPDDDAAIDLDDESAIADTGGPDEADPGELSDDDWEAALAADADPFADEAEPVAEAPVEPVVETRPDPVATTPPATSTSTVVPPSAPASSPWYMQPLVLGAGAVVIVLILVVLLLARRQRQAAVVPVGGEQKRSVADLFGESSSSKPGPVQEAPQSVEDEAEALKFQIEQNPNDHGAYLELVSLYYAEGERDQFAEWAERYAGRPGVLGSAEWEQVESMGRELLPGHPLFQDGGGIDANEPEPAWADENDVDEDNTYRPPAATAPAPEPEPKRAAAHDITGAGFEMEQEFDLESEFEEAAPIEFEPTPLDRDRLSDTAPRPVPASDDDEDAVPPLSFADSLDTEPVEQSSAGAAAPVDDDMDAAMDEAATKLELARAYLDMGDPEGAKAMLEEVLGEGDTGQRDEARKLLASL